MCIQGVLNYYGKFNIDSRNRRHRSFDSNARSALIPRMTHPINGQECNHLRGPPHKCCPPKATETRDVKSDWLHSSWSNHYIESVRIFNLGPEGKKLLHSDSDLDEEPNHLRAQRSIVKKRAVSQWYAHSLVLPIVWSMFALNKWLVDSTRELGTTIQTALDSMLLVGLANLITEKRNRLWSIKCLAAFPVMLMVTICRSIVEVAMHGVSLYMAVANNVELSLRRVF